MAQDTTGKLGSIKAELRAATQEAQKLGMELARMRESTDNIDPNQIKALENQMSAAVEKTAMLKDQINDTNEQIKVMTAGSPFEKMSNGLSDVGSKIMSLDFEGARESAGRLAEMGKTINFKTAISSVKDLGSTFLTLGKSLLANPLFLLAAVIVLIVVAVVKLLDKIGVLKVIMNALGKVFEWIMIPINAIIEGLKMFTDWLGITNNAAEDSAQKQADSAKKIADAYEEKSKDIIQGYDNEIRMLELNGESTRQVELKKAYVILNTAKARAKEAIAAYNAAKLKGELDEKELSDLRKKADEMSRSAKQAASDISYLQNKYRKEDSDAREKKLKEDQEKQNDADKKAADAAKKANEDAKRRREERNRAIAEADKLLIDLTLSNMQDGVEKELAINNEKFKRLLAQNASNALITAEQRKAIEEQLRIQQDAENKKITDKDLEDKKKAQEDVAAALLELANRERLAKAELNAIDLESQKAFLDTQKEIELQNKDLTESEKLLIEKNYQAQKDALDEEAKKKKEADADAEIEKEYKKNQAKIQIAKDYANAVTSLTEGIFALTNSYGNQDTKNKEERAKKQFKINKALQLSTAIITGIGSVMEAFHNGMKNPIPLLGPATASVYAGIAGAVAVGNIAKIAATQYGGSPSGVGSSSASSPTPSNGGVENTPATPAFNLFGGANQGNNATAAQSAEGNNQNVNVVATVSVEEITSTQNKVAKVSESASL